MASPGALAAALLAAGVAAAVVGAWRAAAAGPAAGTDGGDARSSQRSSGDAGAGGAAAARQRPRRGQRRRGDPIPDDEEQEDDVGDERDSEEGYAAVPDVERGAAAPAFSTGQPAQRPGAAGASTMEAAALTPATPAVYTGCTRRVSDSAAIAVFFALCKLLLAAWLLAAAALQVGLVAALVQRVSAAQEQAAADRAGGGGGEAPPRPVLTLAMILGWLGLPTCTLLPEDGGAAELLGSSSDLAASYAADLGGGGGWVRDLLQPLWAAVAAVAAVAAAALGGPEAAALAPECDPAPGVRLLLTLQLLCLAALSLRSKARRWETSPVVSGRVRARRGESWRGGGLQDP